MALSTMRERRYLICIWLTVVSSQLTGLARLLLITVVMQSYRAGILLVISCRIVFSVTIVLPLVVLTILSPCLILRRYGWHRRRFRHASVTLLPLSVIMLIRHSCLRWSTPPLISCALTARFLVVLLSISAGMVARWSSIERSLTGLSGPAALTAIVVIVTLIRISGAIVWITSKVVESVQSSAKPPSNRPSRVAIVLSIVIVLRIVVLCRSSYRCATLGSLLRPHGGKSITRHGFAISRGA